MRVHAFITMITALTSVAAIMPNPSGGLAKTPPMGWMSWEIFRCDIDCHDNPENCISHELYASTADALAAKNADGSSFLKAGYDTIHIDDCWETKVPPRDPTTGRLVPNATRFPKGFAGLADYVHGLGVQFGIYSDEGTKTCGGYPGSKGHEKIDAQTFSDWGVDYLKLDGCNNAAADYPAGYLAMGEALRAAGQRPITYSCSWPAYLGGDENTKPFGQMAAAGCNLWRNWDDIQCNWKSLESIIDHWGDYGPALQKAAGPGHWNDPDMLLVGNDCITDDEAETQMAMWSLFAAPLIMGNDARKISTPRARATLLNAHAIAVNQDPLGKQGLRVTNASSAATQVWARELADGDVAVGLYNKLGGGTPWTPPPIPTGNCPAWNHTTGGYVEAAGGASGDVGSFGGLSAAAAQKACCANPKCVGFSFDPSNGSGFYKGNAAGGFVRNGAYEGYTLSGQIPPANGGGKPADITVDFAADLGLKGPVDVFDIWAQKTAGTFTGSYTAKGVAVHGTAFLRLSSAK